MQHTEEASMYLSCIDYMPGTMVREQELDEELLIIQMDSTMNLNQDLK